MSELIAENIYYLGPDGSNAHNAMLNFLGVCHADVKNKISCRSIKSALDELKNDENSLCVLPIENSIEGIVRETIDNLLKLKDKQIKIQGEMSLPINHLLLSTGSDKSQIRQIISHPQALAQCANHLYNLFPDVELKEVSSTSYAAYKVSKENNPQMAAIANEACSKLFNLNVLENNLNDEPDNKTRFYILGRNFEVATLKCEHLHIDDEREFRTDASPVSEGKASARRSQASDYPERKEISRQSAAKCETGLDNNSDISLCKTAIVLSTKNKSGALCDVLKIFQKHDINLTYIDSRPSKKCLGEYLFFMELDVYDVKSKVEPALEEVKQYTDFLRILGTFKIY